MHDYYYRLGDFLGSGQFGMVYKGILRHSDGDEVEVAMKTLKKESGKEDRVKFLQEAAIMGQFKHPNVINMYGVVKDGEPVSWINPPFKIMTSGINFQILIVLDLLLKGDLKKHLTNLRSSANSVDAHTLLSYCRQVASGIAYLSQQGLCP